MGKLLKALALVLALTLAFGVTAFADTGDAPASIDITVGEIYPLQKLVEELGGSYKTGMGNRNVRSVACTGAVRCSDHTWPDSTGVYGVRVGQGTIRIDFFEGESLSFGGFNVTAASNPVVKQASMSSSGSLSLLPMLEELGYAAGDIALAVHWDIKTELKNMTVLYGSGSYRYATHGNGEAHSQILLNMADGQIILVNLKIERAKETRDDFWQKMISPIGFFMHPMGWLLIPVAPIIILAQWILWLIDPLIPTKYYDVTPALAF